MVIEGDESWVVHTMEYGDEILYNFTSESYIMLLINVTSIN